MAIKLSTAARNYMLGQGSFRMMFADSQIRLYSGSPPATADLGATGTHLLTITKASGDIVTTPSSIPQMVKVTCAGTTGTSYGLAITGASGAAVTYSVTYATGIYATTLALCNEINRNCPDFMAAVDHDSGVMFLVNRCPGNSEALYVVANAAVGGDAACVVTSGYDLQHFAASNALKFGGATVGTIDKIGSGTAVWSGLGLTAAGTGTSAGYFRLLRTDDAGTAADTTYIYERVQGTVGTSGSDLVLSSATIVSGATTTIDGFKFTLPETV